MFSPQVTYPGTVQPGLLVLFDDADPLSSLGGSDVHATAVTPTAAARTTCPMVFMTVFTTIPPLPVQSALVQSMGARPRHV
jgi:hypothetical protein